MLEHRPRSNPKRKTQDNYKLRRTEYKAKVQLHHQLLCSFFNKPMEPIPEVQKRLHQTLKAQEINKMAAEIAELIKEGE